MDKTNFLSETRRLELLQSHIIERFPIFVEFVKLFYKEFLGTDAFQLTIEDDTFQFASQIGEIASEKRSEVLDRMFLRTGVKLEYWNKKWSVETKLKVLTIFNNVHSWKNSIIGMKLLKALEGYEGDHEVFNGRERTLIASGSTARSFFRAATWKLPGYEQIIADAKAKARRISAASNSSVVLLDGVPCYILNIDDVSYIDGVPCITFVSSDSRMPDVATAASTHVVKINNERLLEFEGTAIEKNWSVEFSSADNTPVFLSRCDPIDIDDLAAHPHFSDDAIAFTTKSIPFSIIGIALAGSFSTSEWSIFTQTGTWIASRKNDTVRFNSKKFYSSEDIGFLDAFDAVNAEAAFANGNFFSDVNAMAPIPYTPGSYVRVLTDAEPSKAVVVSDGESLSTISPVAFTNNIYAGPVVPHFEKSTVSEKFIGYTICNGVLIKSDISGASFIANGRLYDRQGVSAYRRLDVSSAQWPANTIDDSDVSIAIKVNVGISTCESSNCVASSPVILAVSFFANETCNTVLTTKIEHSSVFTACESVETVTYETLLAECDFSSGEIVDYISYTVISATIAVAAAETVECEIHEAFDLIVNKSANITSCELAYNVVTEQVSNVTNAAIISLEVAAYSPSEQADQVTAVSASTTERASYIDFSELEPATASMSFSTSDAITNSLTELNSADFTATFYQCDTATTAISFALSMTINASVGINSCDTVSCLKTAQAENITAIQTSTSEDLGALISIQSQNDTAVIVLTLDAVAATIDEVLPIAKSANFALNERSVVQMSESNLGTPSVTLSICEMVSIPISFAETITAAVPLTGGETMAVSNLTLVQLMLPMSMSVGTQQDPNFTIEEI